MTRVLMGVVRQTRLVWGGDKRGGSCEQTSQPRVLFVGCSGQRFPAALLAVEASLYPLHPFTAFWQT